MTERQTTDAQLIERAATIATVKQWTDDSNKLLSGRTIQHVHYMTKKEVEYMGWQSRSVIIILDNGVAIYPSRDDEGNDAGALFTSDDSLPIIPVI